MKRCPQCQRTYSDGELNFCLDDGEWLLATATDEPATAIIDPTGQVNLPSTKVFAPETSSATAADVSHAQTQVPSNRNSVIAGVIGIVLVTALGIGSYMYYGRAAAKQINSVAVMPFVNESGNPDLEYLSDGMTETLIRSLSQIPNLSVKARSSVFRYKGKDSDPRIVGKELGVQALLNGRVVQRGDQLTLNLELINAENENVIWTDQYDRKSSDLVSLQNDIARDVSNKLKLRLSGADEQKLVKNYTDDPEAFRLYLQGRFYWNKRTKSEVDKAIPYFKQAVERDPNFALGYVGLADSDEDRDRRLKKEYIRRALDIDDQLAEAHASLGYQYMLDYDWTASEHELSQAKELNPNYPQSYAWNGARLMMIGKYDEALAEMERALELDPTSNGINFYKAVCLGVAGRRVEAVQHFKKLIEMDPTFPWAHSHLSRIYWLNGDLATSVEERAISLELDGKPEMAKGVRETYAQSGWAGLERYMAANNPPDSYFWGVVTPQDKEVWLTKLEKQAALGNFWLFLVKTDPRFDPLRGDPRFRVIVNKFDPPQ